MTGRKITDKEYEHVLNVWKNFEMKTMKDYHDLYLKCDILLISDVFEKLINNSFMSYGLCASHYLSAPGLSWDAVLKMTKIELELIADLDMYIFLKKGTTQPAHDIPGTSIEGCNVWDLQGSFRELSGDQYQN